MRKQVAKAAQHEVRQMRTAGVLSWVIIAVTAAAVVIAWNPYGKVHHWIWVTVALIAGMPLAEAAERAHRRRQRKS